MVINQCLTVVGPEGRRCLPSLTYCDTAPSPGYTGRGTRGIIIWAYVQAEPGPLPSCAWMIPIPRRSPANCRSSTACSSAITRRANCCTSTCSRSSCWRSSCLYLLPPDVPKVHGTAWQIVAGIGYFIAALGTLFRRRFPLPSLLLVDAHRVRRRVPAGPRTDPVLRDDGPLLGGCGLLAPERCCCRDPGRGRRIGQHVGGRRRKPSRGGLYRRAGAGWGGMAGGGEHPSEPRLCEPDRQPGGREGG